MTANEETVVVKRDERTQPFTKSKIVKAVQAAGADLVVATRIARAIAGELGPGRVTVEDLQSMVIQELASIDLQIARAYEAYKIERDRLRAMREQPKVEAIAEYMLRSKYAKWYPEHGALEDWGACWRRNRDMHIKKYPELKEEIDQVYREFVAPKKVLPAMRSLQFGGPGIEKNNTRLYNCWFGKCDNIKFFHRLFFILLSGGGVGYSVQKHHVAKLPLVKKISRKKIKYHKVEDTIEGWGRSVKALFESYFETGEYIEFDYSGVRPEGAWLKTTGGKAPGHVPLKIALEQVRAILETFVEEQLTTFACHRIACILAMAVLSGGIRRSSLIALFSYSDTEMLECKAYEGWWDKYPELRMANNSVALLRSKVTREQFNVIIRLCQGYGEPGFFFTDNLEYGCNPCVEIGMHTYEKGSFQGCNLVEINCATLESPEDFYRRCVAAAYIATLQAGYDEFSYLGTKTEVVVRKEALIGVSLCGVMDSEIARRPDVRRAGAGFVNKTNAEVAQRIGIEPAARTTTGKPAGSTSLFLGCIASGHMTHPCRRYFRLITANPNEPVFQWFKRTNPHMCQEKPDGDWVIKFPVEAPSDAVITSDLSAIEFLDFIFDSYDNWIVPGTARTDVSPGLTNNISCTCPIQTPDEWVEVEEHLWENRHRVAAMSFLKTYGQTYDFLPRTPVREEDEAAWNTINQLYQPVDYGNIDPSLYETGITDRGGACDGAACDL